MEVCPVTVPNPVPPSPRPSYLATAYDFAGSDQGLSVDDPANKVTWLFAGDAKSADSNAWFGVTPTTAGGANMIGYLDGPDYGNPAGLCSHLKLVTVPGMTSKSGGAVWSPDVMLPPPGDPVSNYIFNPTPNKSGATVPTLPPGAGIPGINEATTGAFLDAGTIYLFYAGSPGILVNPDRTLGLPVTSVSYLAAWRSPSPTGTTPDVAPTTYRILARVDYSLENTDTTTCPASLPAVCPPAPPAGWLSTAPSPPLGGHFVWVEPVEGGDGYVYLYGTGKYRASNVYLARLPVSSLASIGQCSSPPCYLGTTPGFQIWTAAAPGGAPNAPGWSSSPPSTAEIGAAAPLVFPDDPNPDLGQISVRFFDSIGGGGLWVMMGTPVGNPAFAQKLIARWSLSPTGPWSDALVVFDVSNAGGSQNQRLYCCQGSWNMKLDTSGLKVWECLAPQDGAAAQQMMECRDAGPAQTAGSAGPPRYGFYSPFMLPWPTNVSRSSQVQSGVNYVTDTFTVSYLISIFEPYNSVLMSYALQAVTASDFSVAVSPPSAAAAPGGSATASVTTAMIGSFRSPVSLSASGLPAGVSASFSPPSIDAPGSGASTLTLSVSPGAAPGTWPVTVTASGGGLAHTAAVQLTVTSSGPLPGAGASKLVPVVLDVAGVGGSRYTTQLTLANRGTTSAAVQLTYTAAAALGASGSGTAQLTLSPGQQLVIADAIAYLRSQGLAIPAGSNQGGTLLAAFTGLSSSDAAFVGARTTTPSGAGRAGLAYPGVDLQSALTGTSFVYGLRSTAADRTNLGLVNASSNAPITLRVTLSSGDAGDGRTFTLAPDTTLAAGQWVQIGRVLDAAGFVNGYARIDLVSGTGPYLAYAVFNDNTTEDGSYAPAEPSTTPSEMRLLPVLVESPGFQSELVLTNPLAVPQSATLSYVESLSPASGAGGTLTLAFEPGEQKIIPDAIDYLRQQGVAIGPKGATYAGALAVTFLNGAARSTGFAGARTAAPVGGTGPGEYGLFYPGTGPSFAALNEAWVYGLQQDGTDRTNLAVANLGDAGDPITFRVDVFDGSTGQMAGSVPAASLAPGAWSQIDAVLKPFGLANGYARVVKLTGRSRFLPYAVVNDGGAPGQGTSDGSYVAGQAVAPISSFSVGPDLTLTYPDLPVLSDEHTTVLPPPPGSDTYLVFAANAKNAAGLSGPVVLETTDLRTFGFAAGYTSPVMTAPIAFTTCKAAYDPEFDLNYASPGSVLPDPTRPSGNLMMVYEAENHCPGAVWQHDFYATVGFARSSDDGRTWPAPADAELGGADRYPVLKASTPEPGMPENPQVAMGNAIPSAFVDGDKLYVTYSAPGPTADGMLRVARAPLGGNGPVTFSKWLNGAFSEPGIGGQDSGVLPARGCTGHQGMGSISYDDALGLYLMTFVCSSSTQGAWFYSTATSLDRQNWTAPQMIGSSQLPVTSGCATDGTGNGFDGWYPSFMSPGSQAGHITMTGSVFYMDGCDRGSRTFRARTFTLTAPPPPGN